MEHKQVIVLRKDLNMRKGKMVVQGAHASMAALLNLGTFDTQEPGATFSLKLDERVRPWLQGRFKKICVGVQSEQELLELHRAAQKDGLICALIQDAGLTEFGGVPTYTALAVGPDEDEKIDRVTGRLGLL